MSNIQPDDAVFSIMREIRTKHPVLHDDLLKQLGTINNNIKGLPKEVQKAAVKILFISIADRLTDENNLRRRFLKTFKMDTGFKEWDVDEEKMDEDIERVLIADASTPDLAYHTSITAENPHEIIISQDGSVRNVERTFGREIAGKSTPSKTVKKTGKKGGKRGKTNRNKKISKTRKSLKRRPI